MRTPLWIISLLILSATSFVAFADNGKPLSVTVEFDDLKIDNGNLDRESARRAMSAQKRNFAACGFSEGSMSLRFQVSETGQITDSDAVFSPKRNEKVEDCFKSVLSKVDFSFSGIQQTVRMSLQFEIGREERLAKKQAEEAKQAKVESSIPMETEADRKNREYGERQKAQALAEMSAQIERQKAEQAISLGCYEKFQKDKLLEDYEKCLAQGSKSGNSCRQNCESQRLTLQMSCENCQGSHVAKNNCRTSCRRNIDNQINLCTLACR